MNKILIAAYSLDVGGIEKALINLTNYLIERKHDVTLVLEKYEGIYLNQLNSNIKIIQYSPSDKKIINMFKRMNFCLKYKEKYDTSINFATYSLMGSFVTRMASKNSILWGHADYLSSYNNNLDKMKEFFIKLNYHKFNKIVFVSRAGANSFVKAFPKMKNKVSVCNNLINGYEILEKSKEQIEEQKANGNTTFVNIGRHDEKQKQLMRLFEAAKKLKNNGYNFDLLCIGNGKDSSKYIEFVEQNGLTQNVKFLGLKSNPYPYFKMADCVVLTSDYEGYPVVFLESRILNKPLITTKVSDYEEIENKYGILTEKTSNGTYLAMKQFMEEGFEINEKFDYEEYNQNIKNKIERLL